MDRRKYGEVEVIALLAQVGRHCPRCNTALIYQKGKRSYKGYELAHIYPLHPRPEELIELQGVGRLGADVNATENIIPLCTGCHTKFDKPRTRDEYNELIALKEELLRSDAQRAINAQYPLEGDLRAIVLALHNFVSGSTADAELELNPKAVDSKLDPALPPLLKRKIKRDVAEYYRYIGQAFKELEKEQPSSSELIYAQVRAYYLKQKTLNLSQDLVFTHVVEWIRVAGGAQSLESAEIVASFFVQNCEVFE